MKCNVSTIGGVIRFSLRTIPFSFCSLRITAHTHHSSVPESHMLSLHLRLLVTLHSVAEVCCISQNLLGGRYQAAWLEGRRIENRTHGSRQISRGERTACKHITKPFRKGHLNTRTSYQHFLSRQRKGRMYYRGWLSPGKLFTFPHTRS